MSEPNERDEQLRVDLFALWNAFSCHRDNTCWSDCLGALNDQCDHLIADYREEIEIEQSDEEWATNNSNMREATDALNAERDHLKARDAETVAALKRAGFAHPALSPAENIAEAESRIGALEVDVAEWKAEVFDLRKFVARYVCEAEASGGWNGDDDLFDLAQSLLTEGK
jgi:hypothetical protein